MLDKSGAFYAALDADSEGVEGKFYTWTDEELKQVLGAEFTWVSSFYSVNQRGYWEDGQFILLKTEQEEAFAKSQGWSLEELEDRITKVNQLLLDERSNRVRPGLDDKCLTSWNAMLIAGLVDAYKVFEDESFLFHALGIGRWLRPFVADTDVATAMQRLHESPSSPRDHNAAIHPKLEAIIMRGLAREPSDRFGSINDLRNELAQVEQHATTPAASAAEPFHRSERMWLVPAVFVVVAMVALTVAALLLRQTTTGQRFSDRVESLVGLDDQESDAAAADDAEQIPILDFDTIGLTAVDTHDPFGSGTPGEHDELLPNATDGDAETVWRTETYNDRTFGTKPGVGLTLTLEDEALVASLVLQTTSEDWAVSIYAADAVAERFEDWGDPVEQIAGASGTVAIDLDGLEARVLLLWITDLGVDAQFRLAELAVTAVA